MLTKVWSVDLAKAADMVECSFVGSALVGKLISSRGQRIHILSFEVLYLLHLQDII